MSRETHAHGARSTGASALWNHVREDSRELFHLLGDVSPSPERSRSGSFWRPRWRRLPVAEREHVDLPAAHTARSVVDHDADGGGDDLQLLRHIVRRDTVIMGKTARTDAAGICKDEGWEIVVFDWFASSSRLWRDASDSARATAAASRCWRASLRSAVVASTRAFASARTS